MTLGTYCTQWRAPELPTHKKCYWRVIAQETPGYIGKTICINPNRNGFACCKESEYSIKISADISQELPGYTCEHCGETFTNNYPCPCRFEQERRNYSMGATIPAMQRVSEAAVSLNAEIDAMSQSLANGHRAMGDFRREIQGRWNIDPVEHTPPEGLEDLNPVDCHKFEANEFGNCKNLHWCFRVFGIQLQCQQTRKEVIPKPLKEHRRLEVD